MGFEPFWRCDTCGQDHEGNRAQGWFLKGNRRDANGPTLYDLYFCTDSCASKYFTTRYQRENP